MSLKFFDATAAIAEESNPPDKKVHKGTSPTSCLLIASTNKDSKCSTASSSFSVYSSALRVQYSFKLNSVGEKVIKFPGGTSSISLNIPLPRAVAGPSERSSVIPVSSTKVDI
ncbi:hypothetical protein D3C76_1105690 [compost metagenome]